MRILIENSAEDLKDEIWGLYEKYTYLKDDRWEDGTYRIPLKIVKGNYEDAEDAVNAATDEELRSILQQYKSLEKKLYGSPAARSTVADQIKTIFATDYYEDDLDIQTFWDIIDRNGGELFYETHSFGSFTSAEDELDAYLSTVPLDNISAALKELESLPAPQHLPTSRKLIINKYYNSNPPSKEEKYVISDLSKSTGSRTWGYDIDYNEDNVYMSVDLYTDTGDSGLYKARNEINRAYSSYLEEYSENLGLQADLSDSAFDSTWDDGYPCLQGDITFLVSLIRAYESGDYSNEKA